MNGVLKYTITSTDSSNYNVINSNLQPPMTSFANLTVTCLTTKASFLLLTPNDFIEVNGVKCFFSTDYGELTNEGFADLLNDFFTNITVSVDNVNRLVMSSANPFTINDMSYNTKILSGFYNDTLPLTSNRGPLGNFLIKSSSVGFTLSTPVLYLVSNLGSKCYDNIDANYCDRKILMRINNSFSSNYPIINSNGEFTTMIPVNSLSNIEFRLVDANMKDIKLLSPMYIAVTVEPIEDNEQK